MADHEKKHDTDRNQGAEVNIGPRHSDEKAANDPIADKYASGEGKMTENPGRRD